MIRRCFSTTWIQRVGHSPRQTDYRNLQAMEAEIHEILSKTRLSQAEWDKRSLFFEKSRDIMTKRLGSDFTLVEYGSNASRLAMPGSDCDLFLMSQDHDKVPDLDQLSIWLTEAGMDVTLKLGKAQVPLLKYRDPESGINGDLTFNNIGALHNTRLMAAYASIDPLVSDFIKLVKIWAKVCNVANSRQLTLCSYGWSLLALRHLIIYAEAVPNLQTIYSGDRKIVPIPSRLQPGTFNDVDVSFFDDPKMLPTMLQKRRTLPFLFTTFLDFGIVKPFANSRQTQVFYGFRKETNQTVDKRPSCLVVQDPIEPYRNIASSVSQTGMRLIYANACHTSFQLKNGIPISAVLECKS